MKRLIAKNMPHPENLNLVWESDVPSLSDSEKTHLQEELDGLEEALDGDASNLITHTIFLEDNVEGRTLSVYGKPEDKQNLFIVYHDKTEWVKLNDLSEE